VEIKTLNNADFSKIFQGMKKRKEEIAVNESKKALEESKAAKKAASAPDKDKLLKYLLCWLI
jgi:hypothetical protein